MWETSTKGYTLAYVYDLEYHSRGEYNGKYQFKIGKATYKGKVNHGKDKHLQYFIAEFIIEVPKTNRINIEIPVNPKSLTAQPPEGWTECPINKDGTIKEKFKAKSKLQ